MRIAAFCIVLSFLAIPALAAGIYNPQVETIAALNKYKPLQNPDWERSSKILNRKMLDNKNKVIGTVKDVTLNENGTIVSLYVDFDRMHLGTPVFIDFSTLNIEPVTAGYAMSIADAQLNEIYPSLLSQVETASGGGQQEIYPLSKLPGTEVWTEEGRKVGNVQDVLFSGNGRRAQALYVSMKYGSVRAQELAIPFNQVSFMDTVSGRRVIVNPQLAQAMKAYLEQK